MGIRPVSSTGNTFSGLIKEFPGLGVDKFNTIAKVYLLTHCHSDHLCGLRNKSFDSIVYCSEATKNLLSLDPTFRHILPFIVPIEVNVPFTITLNEEEINLTLIPAYHCPGATMFLIEGANNNILYTGDIRAESWWVETLPKNPNLFPYTSGLEVLDNIYLDTTFIYRGEPFIEIPLNNEGISVVTLLIKSYPRDDPDVQFYFVDSTSGFEEAWAQIVNSLKGTLHTNEENKLRIKELYCNELYPHYGRILNHLINKLPSNSGNLKFHACGKSLSLCKPENPKFPVKIKQCIDFNILDFTGMFCPVPLSSISASERIHGLKTLAVTGKGNIIYDFRGRKWLCKKEGNELLPADIKLVFSRHSSYSECRNFISKFKFRDIYPCTASENSWNKGMTMSRLFGDLAYKPSKNVTNMFAYDMAKSLKYGILHSSILDRPIKIVNRWDVSQCVDEIQWVKGILSKTSNNLPTILNSKFNYQAQKPISKYDFCNYAEEEKKKFFYKERNKDMQLQKIVIGRGEAWYRRIIENQQKLYCKFHNDIESGVLSVLGREPDIDIQFNDGMKLGGVDRYNFDNGSFLNHSSDNHLHSDKQNTIDKNIQELSMKLETNSYESGLADYLLELIHKDELTDIEDNEDNESDDSISEFPCTEKIKPQQDLKRKRNSIEQHGSRKSLTQGNIKRPCLKRSPKNNHQNPHNTDFSFIESSFSSLEISFKRQITDIDDKLQATSESKQVSQMLLARRQISSSKIYFKSCADVNSAVIQNVSNDLNDDPANWFSLKLKSVDMQFNQVSNFT